VYSEAFLQFYSLTVNKQSVRPSVLSSPHSIVPHSHVLLCCLDSLDRSEKSIADQLDRVEVVRNLYPSMTENKLARPARKAVVAMWRHNQKPVKKGWLEVYGRLKDFYRLHGNSNVPQRYPDDPALGAWVSRQRGSRHRQLLTDVQRSLLAEVEFTWEVQRERFDRLWNESYEKLKEYKNERGNCDVPAHYGRDQPRALGNWVHMQKQRYHQGLLRDDRKRRLKALGFNWEMDPQYVWRADRDVKAQELLWQENYEKLVEFTRTYGHTLVPNLFVNGKPECLGRWVRAQRTSYLQNTLPAYRKELLEELGFIWMVLARGHSSGSRSMCHLSWKEMYARLLSYRQDHGDCRVPSDYSQDEQLAHWVEELRSGLKTGSIHPARIERLDAIGFLTTKENYATHWNEQFENLVSYQNQHNSTVVTHTSAGRLLRWTIAQRYLYRRRLLWKEQEERLQSIGFDWCSHSSSSPLAPCVSTTHSRTHQVWDEPSDEGSAAHDNFIDSENAVNPGARRKLRNKPLNESARASKTCGIPVEGVPSKKRRLDSQQNIGQYRGRFVGYESRGCCRVDMACPESCEGTLTAVAFVDNRNREDGRIEWDETPVATEMTTQQTDDVDCHGDYQEPTMGEKATRHSDHAQYVKSTCELIDDADQERERIDCSVLYPIGTRVRKHYDCYGWVAGTIVQFEGVYRVRYEDGDEEDFLNDDKELVDIVERAKGRAKGSSLDGIILPVGTPVHKYFPTHGWFAGEIVAFDGVYLVRHDDCDEEELFYDSPELAAIVANAKG
jgi:Helicase associated domain